MVKVLSVRTELSIEKKKIGLEIIKNIPNQVKNIGQTKRLCVVFSI